MPKLEAPCSTWFFETGLESLCQVHEIIKEVPKIEYQAPQPGRRMLVRIDGAPSSKGLSLNSRARFLSEW